VGRIMKALDTKVGQLIKTDFGLATIIKFWAPKSVSCIIVTRDTRWKPGSPGYERYAQGELINIRGFDFDAAEILSEGR
jgi:hypothetical protein